MEVTDEMLKAACGSINTRGKGNNVTIPDIKSMLEAALSAQAQDVAIPDGWQLVPYKGALSSLSNGRDLKMNIPIVNLPIGMKLYATHPSPLAAVKALEFYANPENWIDTPSWDGDPDCITPKAIPVIDDGPCDCGDTARDALNALYAQGQNVAASPAIKAIAAERARQIEKEGWSPAHDDKYINGELLEAAACYALHNGGELDDAPGAWPWSRDFWKPTTRQRDLEKAGALIAAELDRVIRAAAPAEKQEDGE